MSNSILSSTALKLHASARVFRNLIGPRLAELGLHPGSDLILVELWREAAQTQAELAERLGVSAPNVTKLVRRLERAGLVTRLGDPNDARVLRIHPTPAGRRLRRPVERVWREAERTALAGLTAAERRQLRELLSRALGAQAE